MQRQRLLMVQQCFQDQRHRPIIDALDSRQPTAENETEHKILLNHYTQRRVTPASPNNIATRLPPGAINYLDRPNARYHVPDSIPPSLWPALGSNSANVHLGSKITIVQRSDDLQEHSAPSIASATHQSTREPANPFAVLLPSLITSNEDRSGTAVDPNGHLMRSSAALLNPDNLIKQFSWLSVDPTGSHLAVNTVNASADSPKCGNPAHLPDASLSTSRTLQEDSLTFHGIHPAGTSSDDMTTQLLYGAIDYFGVSIPCCSVRKLKSALPLSASGTKPATDVHLRKSETLSLQGPKARDGTQDSLASATSQSADTPANLVKAPKSGPNTFKECSDSHQAANASHSRECSNSARRSTARLPGPQDGMMMSTHQDEELLMFTDRPSFERSNDPQCNAGTSQDSSSASQPLHPAHPTATLQPTTDRIHHNQVNPPSGISGDQLPWVSDGLSPFHKLEPLWPLTASGSMSAMGARLHSSRAPGLRHLEARNGVQDSAVSAALRSTHDSANCSTVPQSCPRMPEEDVPTMLMGSKGHLTRSSVAPLSPISRRSDPACLPAALQPFACTLQEDGATIHGIQPFRIKHTSSDNCAARILLKAINCSGGPDVCNPVHDSESSSPLLASSSKFAMDVHLCGSKASSLQRAKAGANVVAVPRSGSSEDPPAKLIGTKGHTAWSNEAFSSLDNTIRQCTGLPLESTDLLDMHSTPPSAACYAAITTSRSILNQDLLGAVPQYGSSALNEDGSAALSSSRSHLNKSGATPPSLDNMIKPQLRLSAVSTDPIHVDRAFAKLPKCSGTTCLPVPPRSTHFSQQKDSTTTQWQHDMNDRLGVSNPCCSAQSKTSDLQSPKAEDSALDSVAWVTLQSIHISADLVIVGGLDKQIERLVGATVFPIKPAYKFKTTGIKPPKGALTYGPPGTGKTLLARACATQTDACYLKLAGPSLVQMFTGDGVKFVRDTFELAKEKAPAIIPTNELDTIGTKRFDSDKSGDCEVQRTTLELLNQLDGFGDERIKVIAATNRIDILDPALLRSGRLDRKIEFPLPNETARARILEIHSRKMTAAAGVNFEELSRSTDEFNGAQLKAICVVQMFTGNSTKLVSNASKWDKEKVPAIIFIDELDAIGTKRFDSDKDSDQEAQCTDTSNEIWDPYQATNASRSHNCGDSARQDITCLPSLQDGRIMPALPKEEWQQHATAENEFVLEPATNLRCNASAPRDTLPTTRLWNLAHVTLTSRPNLGKWPGYGQTMNGIHPNRANQVGITLNDTASHLRPNATNNCEASPARSPQAIAKREHQLLIIDPEDILGCQEAMSKLCLHVRHYACRYARLTSGVVDELAPQPTKNIPNDGNILKVILHQRREKIQEKEARDLAGFLPQCWHRYNLYFKPLSLHKVLVGFVTRVSEAKPLLLANAYTCNTRRSEIPQATSDERFLWCSIDPKDIHNAVIDPYSLDCGRPASLNSLLAPGPQVGRTMTAYQDRVPHLSQEPMSMLASPLVASLPDYQCPTGAIMHPFERQYLTWAQRSSHDPLHTTTISASNYQTPMGEDELCFKHASNPQGITKRKDCKTRHATYNWERRIALHPVLNLVWSIPALSYNSTTEAPGIEFASGPDTLSPRLALGYDSAASTRLSSTTTSRLHSMTEGDTQGDPVGFVASMTRQSRQTSFVAAVRSGHSAPNENDSPTDPSDKTKQCSWRLFSVMDTCQTKHRRSIPCVPQEGAIVHGTCTFRAINYPEASDICKSGLNLDSLSLQSAASAGSTTDIYLHGHEVSSLLPSKPEIRDYQTLCGILSFRVNYPGSPDALRLCPVYYSEPPSLRPTPSANLGATMSMHCDEELPSCQWLSMMPHVGHSASLSDHQYYTAVDRSSCEQRHNVVTPQGQAAGSPDDQQGKPEDNTQDSCLSPSLLLPPYPANITITPLTEPLKAQEASVALHDDADNYTSKEDLPTILDCDKGYITWSSSSRALPLQTLLVCPTGKMALVTGPRRLDCASSSSHLPGIITSQPIRSGQKLVPLHLVDIRRLSCILRKKDSEKSAELVTLHNRILQAILFLLDALKDYKPPLAHIQTYVSLKKMTIAMNKWSLEGVVLPAELLVME